MLLTGPVFGKGEFDPDAYLRSKTRPQAFDPDSYLREKRINDMSKTVTGPQALGAGAVQGGTLGFGDEMAGGYAAAQKQIERMPELLGVPDAELYASAMAPPDEAMAERDKVRESNEAAKRAHGGLYLAGELAGGVVPTAMATMATGGAALPTAIGQGALQGAGYSTADTAGGLARDSAIGGAVGAAGHAVGETLGGTFRRLADLAKSKSAAAAGRAATQAGEESRAAVGSLVGKYGGLRQTENNAILSSLAAEEKGQLEPALVQRLAQLKASGRVKEAINESVANNLDFLETRIPEVAAAKKAMQDAQAALPQTIADRTAELSKPQFGKDLASLAKSYGEPLAAAALAPAGLKPAAALLFGRTRAGKAVASRVNRPGNQKALWDAVQNASEAPLKGGELGDMLRRALEAAAAQRGTEALVPQ